MVILKQNVRTKAGLLPAGTDVEGKLSDEVVEDLIKTGLASRPSEKVKTDADDSGKSSKEQSELETEQSDDEATEQDSEVKEDEQLTDDAVDLNLPETGNTTKTTSRGRGRKAKS